MITQFLAAAASVAVIGAGAVGSVDVRASDVVPMAQTKLVDGDSDGAAGTCRVDVIRTGDSGTVSTTRSVLNDNSCVCTVVTGPTDANGNAEEVVTGILRDRRCAESPTVGKPVSEAARSGGASGAVIPVVVGVVAAAGLAVALGAHSRG